MCLGWGYAVRKKRVDNRLQEIEKMQGQAGDMSSERQTRRDWKQDYSSRRKRNSLRCRGRSLVHFSSYQIFTEHLPTKHRALCTAVSQAGGAELSGKRQSSSQATTSTGSESQDAVVQDAPEVHSVHEGTHTHTTHTHNYTTFNRQHSQQSNHFCRVHHFSSEALKILLTKTFKYTFCFFKCRHKWGWHL